MRPSFIWATLGSAFLLNLLPGGARSGSGFFALTLVFWNVHQPRKVGMGIAFVFGLLMDVHNGALFGEHALAYTLLSYGAITLHRRIQWFPVASQAIYVLGLLLMAQLASRPCACGSAVPRRTGGWAAVQRTGRRALALAHVAAAAPQRRPAERDDTRPSSAGGRSR